VSKKKRAAILRSLPDALSLRPGGTCKEYRYRSMPAKSSWALRALSEGRNSFKSPKALADELLLDSASESGKDRKGEGQRSTIG